MKAAAAYPISWNEAPAYQRIYDQNLSGPASEEEMQAALPLPAVAAAMEMLHDDFAYEFELLWDLWIPDQAGGLDPVWKKRAARGASGRLWAGVR